MILTFCYLKDTILQTRNKLMSAIEKFTLKAINVVSTTTPYRSRMETKNLLFILIDQKGTETPLKGSVCVLVVCLFIFFHSVVTVKCIAQ